MMSQIGSSLVLIKGAGDLASGVAARLLRCGFPVVMTELPQPLMVRRAVCFGEAVIQGEVRVEEIVARRAADVTAARSILAQGAIPVLIDPGATCRVELAPAVLVDAIMAKRNTGTTIHDAPRVIALGPGFVAGQDCHAVVETQRGHWLGRVYWQGEALPDTGVPGEIAGKVVASRILRAPMDGVVEGLARIGDRVEADQVIARVAGVELRAGCNGILRGLIRGGTTITAGTKIGDIDPRAERDYCFTISDKSLAIGGGVLEAILTEMMNAD